MHAVLGANERCIALHASDLAVPLVALDAVVCLLGAAGERQIPLTDFYFASSDSPDVENRLSHGELITAIEIPLLPVEAVSGYLKVRDRVSYEFALASAAVALVISGGVIRQARIGLGGVGSKPWRAWDAERELVGSPTATATFRRAAQVAVQGAWTLPGTAFKVELAQRCLVRELRTVSGVAA